MTTDALPPPPATGLSAHSVVTVVVDGEIDLATAAELDAAVAKCLANRPTSVALDMAGVRFMAAAGVSALLACRARAVRQGTSLGIVRPSPAVDRVLTAVNLRSVLVGDPVTSRHPGTDQWRSVRSVPTPLDVSGHRRQVAPGAGDALVTRALHCLPCGRSTPHAPGPTTLGSDGTVLVNWWSCTQCAEGHTIS